ncbi:MAG: hypothetical protein PGN11_02125 [Quadrisphaera sp.]
MPEGDVVWRSAQRLHAALAGRALERSDLRWPSLATVDLRGRVVDEVVSRGKHLLLRVGGGDGADQPLTLHSHLRMEGSWHVHATGQPVAHGEGGARGAGGAGERRVDRRGPPAGDARPRADERRGAAGRPPRA